MEFYVLDRRNHPVLETDERVWSAWLDSDHRRFLASIDWESEEGQVEVVTTFLGFNALRTSPPSLWDTVAMLYPKDGSDPIRIDQWHYTSKAQALRGHEQMVRALGGHSDNGWHPNVLTLLPAGLVTLRVMGGQLLTTLDDLDGVRDGVIHFLGKCLHTL